jgi:hypothetical protein
MGSNRQILIIAGVIVVGLLGLGYITWLNVRPPLPIECVVQFPRPPRGHDTDVEYPNTGLPPAGGIHFDRWQVCGIYNDPIEIGNATHSTEHGAVWISYQPSLPDEEVEALKERVRNQSFLLLSPFPELRSPIVLTAWGVQLEVNSAGDDRIDEFIDRYRLGPQTPEPGATCDFVAGSTVGQPDE